MGIFLLGIPAMMWHLGLLKCHNIKYVPMNGPSINLVPTPNPCMTVFLGLGRADIGSWILLCCGGPFCAL